MSRPLLRRSDPLSHGTPFRAALARVSSHATLALLGVTAACATACTARTPAQERAARAARNSGDVVVAVAWPWAARADIRYGEGLEMATNEVNSAGGIGGRACFRNVGSRNRRISAHGRRAAATRGSFAFSGRFYGH